MKIKNNRKMQACVNTEATLWWILYNQPSSFFLHNLF